MNNGIGLIQGGCNRCTVTLISEDFYHPLYYFFWVMELVFSNECWCKMIQENTSTVKYVPHSCCISVNLALPWNVPDHFLRLFLHECSYVHITISIPAPIPAPRRQPDLTLQLGESLPQLPQHDGLLLQLLGRHQPVVHGGVLLNLLHRLLQVAARLTRMCG